MVGTSGGFGPLKRSACGLSNEKPTDTALSRSWTTLNCGFRLQVNPRNVLLARRHVVIEEREEGVGLPAQKVKPEIAAVESGVGLP